jgi:hypothetical protein
MATKKAPASKKATTVKKASTSKRITEASIRKRAEQIYLKRMEEGIPGDADSDWRQAEQELRKL